MKARTIVWTQEQAAAIQTDGSSLLISAAAGSGKTAVLAERVVRLVREGADIGRFLIVTFTEAATAEMKRRIARRLNEAAAGEEDAAAAERLREQAVAAGRANISTLHAFCLYILRRNFHMLELDPAFRAGDSVQAAMLMEQALEECAASYYEADRPEMRALLKAVGGKQPEKALFELVNRLYAFLMAQPRPWEWLEQAVQAYEAGPAALAAHPGMAALLELARETAAEVGRLLLRARESVPPGKESVLALLDDDLAQLRSLQLYKEWGAFREGLQAIRFGRFYWPKQASGEAEPQKEIVKRLRDEARAEVKGLQSLFGRTLEEEAAVCNAFAHDLRFLAEFINKFHNIYKQYKQERCIVDFSDMEHLALQALEDDSVRENLRKRFQYIFVDEYQDSSHIQEALIERVRGEGNLFLVGDVKQSIYRFRQADPSLFLQKYEAYSGEPGGPGRSGSSGRSGKTILLNRNFRSAQPVIDAVNDVFSRIMTRRVGEIDYGEDAALIGGAEECPRESTLPGCELHVIEHAMRPREAAAEEAPPSDPPEAPEAAEGREDEESAEDAQVEAMLAAARIQELMRTERMQEKGGATRKLRYSDFVVLLRAQRPVAQTWAQTLAGLGIPAYVQLTGGYFDALEVQVLLNLLRVIDNARQDIPLLSALRAPVFGFTLEELVELRTAYEAETLHGRMLLCAQREDALSPRVRAVFAALERWRGELRLLPLESFLARLLEETGFYDDAGALPAGRERQANLNALLHRAEEYAAAQVGGVDLGGFLAHMDGAAATAQLGAAQAGAADVVRVLSMHAAKGLEYPVVFLAGLGRRFFFRTKEPQEQAVFDRELGIGVRMVQGRVRRDTLLRNVIVRQSVRRQLAEEMRILYVGMTRAKSRLIMLGCASDAQERLQRPAASLSEGECAGARMYLDWLIPASAYSEAISRVWHAREDVIGGARALAGLEQQRSAQQIEWQPHLLEQVRQRFAWRYPFEEATRIPTKRSVSDLAGEAGHNLEDPPAFARRSVALTPAQQGSAVHTALLELRLGGMRDGEEPAYIKEEISRMVASGILSQRQADSIRVSEIAGFYAGPHGKRLRRAGKVEREWEFAVEIPAAELLELESQEPVLLQGVIDCCFLEDGEWVLLDFKTDHRRSGVSVQQAAQAHRRQVVLYAEALERLTDRRVKERALVMLRYGAVVPV